MILRRGMSHPSRRIVSCAVRLVMASLMASFILLIPIDHLSAGDSSTAPPSTIAFQVEDRAPIIDGRQDIAFQRALESSFRKAVLLALRRIAPRQQSAEDFSQWQTTVLSRARDFIFSYSILSMEADGGVLSLSLKADVYRNKLEETIQASMNLSPALPVRILVLVESHAMAGAGDEGDIDAGRLAAVSLETELSRRGAIIISSPDHPPWQHLEGKVSEEYKISLAAAEGTRLEADFVILGRIFLTEEKFLALSVRLLSASSQKLVSKAQAPFDQSAGSQPGKMFSSPARSVISVLSPKLSRLSARPRPSRQLP